MNRHIECSNKPWFGPKKRAKELLIHRTHVLQTNEAIKIFEEFFGDEADEIQGIRFIDYVHKSNKTLETFRYTIALIWTGPSHKLREKIYEKAKDIVLLSGWYPLPQGERMCSGQTDFQFRALTRSWTPKRFPLQLGNKFYSTQSAVPQEGGCCIRVQCDKGAFVLDTGISGAFQPLISDHLVLLSHSHNDHSGGIVNGACINIPTIMSSITARILFETRRVSSDWLKRWWIMMDSGQEIVIDGLTINAFAVPHCPGSVGYIITAANGTIVFPGDLTIKSARHNFLPNLSEIVSNHKPERCTIFLDATMAGRPYGVKTTNTAEQLLRYFSDFNDIVLVSKNIEQLLYAYLDLFHTSNNLEKTKSTIEFILASGLHPVFKMLHSSFIKHELDKFDPFLTAQYGKTMSSWAESRWLFWMGTNFKLEDNLKYKRLWLITNEEINMIRSRGKLGIVPIGHNLSVDTSNIPDFDFLDVDVAVWSQHSDEVSVYEMAKQFQSCNAVVLFHNYVKRSKKFLKTYSINGVVINEHPQELWHV